MGAFGDGRVELVAQSVIESEFRVDFECVLHVGVHVVAVDGSGADVWSVGHVWRRHGNNVGVGVAHEQTAESVGQRVARLHVVPAAGRGDEGGRIYGAAAEVVFPVGA